MAPVILTILVLLAVCGLLIYLSTRWSLSYMQRVMNQRVQAVDQIVNEERVPEAWLESYQKKCTSLDDNPKREALLTRYQSLARKRCIANLDELIRYTEAVTVQDAGDAKAELMQALRAQRERWEDSAFWDMVFEKATGIEHASSTS